MSRSNPQSRKRRDPWLPAFRSPLQAWLLLTMVSALIVGLPSCTSTHVAHADLPPAGTEYVHILDEKRPWSIHVVRLERKRFTAHMPLGQDRVFQLEPLSKIVAGLPDSLGKPVVAVNGDFFELNLGPYQGDLVGLHILAGELVSEPARTSIWLDAKGAPQIADVHSKMNITLADQQPRPFRLNRSRRDTGIVVYTPRFGQSTHTTGGVEFILRPAGDQREWLPLRASQTYRCRIAKRRAAGDTTIPADAVVLSVGPKTPVRLPGLGAEVILDTAFSQDFSEVQDAIGGNPVLIRNGEIAVRDQADAPRHPRTAFGYSDKHIVLVVVDGRQKHLSIGMTFYELAVLMKEQGCTEAVNLDGGGSSTMWFNGRVVNSPSGFGERPLANALVFLTPNR